MDLIDIFQILLVAFIAIQVLRFFVNANTISQLEERVEHLKYLNSIIHQVKIEKNGEMEYWFDGDNDQFLGQGKTKQEIINHVKSRFPDHIFLLGELGGVGAKTDWQIMTAEELKEKVTKKA